MSVTIIADDIAICEDCVMVSAGVGGDAWHVAAMESEWPDGAIEPTCPEECEGWFSWRACDGCGSTNGGNRHPAIVVTRTC